jgi:hypothetical protein
MFGGCSPAERGAHANDGPSPRSHWRGTVEKRVPRGVGHRGTLCSIPPTERPETGSQWQARAPRREPTRAGSAWSSPRSWSGRGPSGRLLSPLRRVAEGRPHLPPDDIGAGTCDPRLLLPYLRARPRAAPMGPSGKAKGKAGDHRVQGGSPAFRVQPQNSEARSCVRPPSTDARSRQHRALGSCSAGSAGSQPAQRLDQLL